MLCPACRSDNAPNLTACWRCHISLLPATWASNDAPLLDRLIAEYERRGFRLQDRTETAARLSSSTNVEKRVGVGVTGTVYVNGLAIDQASADAFLRGGRTVGLTHASATSGANFGDFLAFRRMVTPIALQFVFWIGVGLLCLVTLLAIVQHRNGYVLLLTLVPIVIVWRMLCEVWILFFSMHDTLSDIRAELLHLTSSPDERPSSGAVKREP